MNQSKGKHTFKETLKNEALDPPFDSMHMKKKLENQLETTRIWSNPTMDAWLFNHVLPSYFCPKVVPNITQKS